MRLFVAQNEMSLEACRKFVKEAVRESGND